MSEAVFFPPGHGLTLQALLDLVGGRLVSVDADPGRLFRRVASLNTAMGDCVSFSDNGRYRDDLLTTRAGLCLTNERNAPLVPPSTLAVIVPRPQAAYVTVARALFPTSLIPAPVLEATGIAAGAHVHATARIETGAVVEPGAVIGAHAEIGAGSLVGAGSVIGPHVKIGRGVVIGPHCSLSHVLIGNRVILHPGVRVGQDGFGFLPNGGGHIKIPQLGRVILQDDVEIGANTAIDRGANRDTVIGEGSKIDNLCQIGHNVMIGRHCLIAGGCLFAGSATLGDYVMIGGGVMINNHITVGDNAQIAATSIVNDDVPAGVQWGGWPARPVKEWFREIAKARQVGYAPRKTNDHKDDPA